MENRNLIETLNLINNNTSSISLSNPYNNPDNNLYKKEENILDLSSIKKEDKKGLKNSKKKRKNTSSVNENSFKSEDRDFKPSSKKRKNKKNTNHLH